MIIQVAINLVRTPAGQMQKFYMAAILFLQVKFCENLIRPRIVLYLSTCQVS